MEQPDQLTAADRAFIAHRERERVAALIGEVVELLVREPPFQAWLPVVRVAYAPSFGRERWTVRAADGTEKTVSEARLRAIENHYRVTEEIIKLMETDPTAEPRA